MILKRSTPTELNMFHPLSPPPAGENNCNLITPKAFNVDNLTLNMFHPLSPPPAGDNNCNLITPKAFNVDNLTLNMFHPLSPPPAGENKRNLITPKAFNVDNLTLNMFHPLSPPPAGDNNCNLITPKAFNVDNPEQAAGAARGRNGAHTISELRRSSTSVCFMLRSYGAQRSHVASYNPALCTRLSLINRLPAICRKLTY